MEGRKYYSERKGGTIEIVILQRYITTPVFPPDASQFSSIAAKGIPDSVTIFADRKNGTVVQTDIGITSHSLYIFGNLFRS